MGAHNLFTTLASDYTHLNYIAPSTYRILRYSTRPFVLSCDKTSLRLQLCCCLKQKKEMLPPSCSLGYIVHVLIMCGLFPCYLGSSRPICQL